jgi:hypothetical protein
MTQSSLCDKGRQVDCRSASRSLLIKNVSNDARDRLTWRWQKGAATTLADFGAPTGTTAYALCLYAGTSTAAIAAADIAPSAKLWSAKGTRGFRYRDPSGSSDGIRKVILEAGVAGKAKVVVRGEGANLPAVPAGPLPLAVTAQLVNNATDVCFEDVYDDAVVKENDAERFTASTITTDLYVAASGSLNGRGSVANPYRRITDAVVRARAERTSGTIPSNKRIRIHVAPGTYIGSFDPIALQNHPEYEVLPIILNVPQLAVLGATVLVRDERGLPTAAAPEGETIFEPDRSLDQSQNLFLVTRTTDGAVGDGVTIEGFVLDGKGEVRYPNLPVFVDRVSDFRIANNLIQHGSFGVTTRLASGTIEGNLLMQNAEAGAVATGGSIAQPARVLVYANRVTGNGQHGIMTMGTATLYLMDRGSNPLELLPLQTAFDRNDLEDLRNIPDTLAVTVSGNDFSHYSVFGIRHLAVVPLLPNINAPCSGPLSYQTQDASQPLTAVLTANVLGNTFDGSGRWGLGMSPGFPCRTDPRLLMLTFAGSFEGNTFAASLHPPALFTFTAWSFEIFPGVLNDFGFARESSYQITDADGELAGFDYVNPVMDPLTSVVLNNTFTVNGVEVPLGTSITTPH